MPERDKIVKLPCCATVKRKEQSIPLQKCYPSVLSFLAGDYNTCTHVRISSSLAKKVTHLLTILHQKKLHCPIHWIVARQDPLSSYLSTWLSPNTCCLLFQQFNRGRKSRHPGNEVAEDTIAIAGVAGCPVLTLLSFLENWSHDQVARDTKI